MGRGPFRLGDPARVRALVEDAGFASPRIEDVPLTWRYASFEEYWDTSRDLSFSLGTTLLTLGPSDIARLDAAAREALRPYAHEGGALVFPGLTRNVSARKPGDA